MRIAVISDIHGNLEALEAVLADIDRQRPDSVLCLGDNIGYGPEPAAVLQRLAARGIPSVRGNHELAVVRPRYRGWFNPSARRSLEKTIGLLTRAELDLIAGFPPFLSRHGCRFVHGFPPRSALLYHFQVPNRHKCRVMQRIAEPVCFVGHTHLLELMAVDGRHLELTQMAAGEVELDPGRRHIVNIGSVGQPRDGGRQAAYVIYDRTRHRLQVRCLDYDAAATAAKMRTAGWPEEHARRLLP